MKNMKTAMKLAVSFVILILLASIIGAVGIIGMNSINNADDELYNYNVVAISAMGDIRANMQRTRVGLRNLALHAENPDMLKTQMDTMTSVINDVKKQFTIYESTITDESLETEYYKAKNTFLDEYVPFFEQVYNASLRSADEAQELVLSDYATKVANDMMDAFITSMNNNNSWAKEKVEANTALFFTMTIIEIVMLIVAIALAIFLIFYISGLISKPVGFIKTVLYEMGVRGRVIFSDEEYRQAEIYAQAKDEVGQSISMLIGTGKHLEAVGKALETVSMNDLTVSLELLSDDDTIGLSLQKMMTNLNNMFSEINASTTQVATGSKQIADGAQALAQGSTEQAAAVEELSSSISDIAQQTKANAEMADKAASLAARIMNNAEKGNMQMAEMTTAVQEINQASQSINKVIKVIDDIAFQTNILALNAAVEAARAGQNGKGFAVVAEEVRSLAAKSADAAKDTGGLIANSMEKAVLGARIADETAASLADIVTGIKESSTLIAEIARSSEEQSVGISQINKGIDQVTQVVQLNSATAQESAAASEEMSGQSDMLGQLVAQFKLKDDAMDQKSLSSANIGSRRRISTPDRGEHQNGGINFGKY